MMKPAFVLVSAFALIAPLEANDVCSAHKEVAEHIMTSRQNGVSIEMTIQGINNARVPKEMTKEQKDALHRDLTFLAKLAYITPKQTSRSKIVEVTNDFGTMTYNMCIDHINKM